MFDPKRAIAFFRRIALGCLIILCLLLSVGLPAVYLSYELGIRPRPQSLVDPGLLVLLGMLPGIVALWTVWRIAGRFMRSLYGLESNKEGRRYLFTRLFGQLSGGPYLIVKEGKVAVGSEGVRKVGGPGGLVVYNDSAVVLERAGKFTQVVRGSATPPFPIPPPRLDPFEKIWDVIDLRPQHWVFKVSAITQDGIPIKYNADISFQVGDTKDDVFKAATCKWIREAWRTEPDRLMTWPKRVIIADTEGALRSILARYTLDQLIDPACREKVRDELEKNLKDAAPKLGGKILRVALGDIELKGQVIQQWFDAWRAERARAMQKILTEGKAARTRVAEEARADVQISRLDHTARVFDEMTKRGQKISNFVILSLVERIKRTSYNRSLYLPDNIVKTLDLLQERCEKREPPIVINW